MVRAESPRYHLAMFVHKNARGERLSFVGREWQRDLYKDHSPDIVCMKASRVGVSEFFIVDMFERMSTGLNWMYMLPTQPLRNRFVSARIDPVILQTEFYRSHVAETEKGVHSKSLKTIFGASVSFVGSNSPIDVWEFDADGMSFDEFDKCDPVTLEYAKDRIGASKHPHTRKIGNPTVGSRGIAKEYEDSDQKTYQVKCDHCNTWQPLTWFDNVVRQVGERSYEPRGAVSKVCSNGIEDLAVVCRSCNSPMDRLAPGRWIAAYPDRPVSGYAVNQIFGLPTKRPVISDLYTTFEKAKPNPTALERFYNNILGIPYEAPGTKIDDQVLAKCVDPEWTLPVTAEGTVAGVDIGLGLHCWFDKIEGGKAKTVWAGVVGSYDELAALCSRFGTVVGCMDAGPEIHRPREFVRDHPGWFLVRYNPAGDKMKQGGVGSDDWKVVDYAKQSISVNRTESLDRMLQSFLMGLVVLPADYLYLNDVAKHLKVPTRVREDRPDGTFRYIWTKGEDHLFHAKNYAHIAASMQIGSLVL